MDKKKFLPQGLTVQIKNLCKQVFGVGNIVLGIWMFVSLATYCKDDACLNVLSSTDLANVGGWLGAIIADLIWQILGISGLLIPLYSLILGGVCLRPQYQNLRPKRIVSFLISILLLSMGMGSYAWPGHDLQNALDCLGGVLGLLLEKKIGGYNYFFLFAGLGCFIYSCSFLKIKISKEPEIKPDKAEPTFANPTFANPSVSSFSQPATTPVFSPVVNKHPAIIKANPQPKKTLPTIEEYKPPIMENVAVVDQIAEPCSTMENLQEVLEEFGIKGEIIKEHVGPVITMYEFKPAPGTKTSRVVGLADDIARSLGGVSARISPISGQSTLGIELPNIVRENVYLKDILHHASYKNFDGVLPLILGKDTIGNPMVVDLVKMPHLLLAGTTGSGKSIGLHCLILSLLYKLSPAQCKLLLIDPKMLEFAQYNDIPHLVSPVVTDPKQAVDALSWITQEMERRYRAMAKLGVRNIEGYNNRISDAKQHGEILMRRVQTGFDPETGKPIYENQSLASEILPHIVVVIDEMADLMLTSGKKIEEIIQRLAQMARAAGIHLITATQRPSVEVITGVIKSNFPARICFQVSSKIDSRIALGTPGAEQLIGKGDMLVLPGHGKILRVHGAFVSEEEIQGVVNYLRQQSEPQYQISINAEFEQLETSLPQQNTLKLLSIKETPKETPKEPLKEELREIPLSIPKEVAQRMQTVANPDIYQQAVALVQKEGKVSMHLLQSKLLVESNRALDLLHQLEKGNIISKPNSLGRRTVLASN